VFSFVSVGFCFFTTSQEVGWEDCLQNGLICVRQVSVAELTTAGVSVLTVSAVDSDSGDNGRVTYSMLPLDSFSISATTGLAILTCMHRRRWEITRKIDKAC